MKLYNGEIEIVLEPRAHSYSIVGTEAKPDGVTTILNLVPKYLLPWVARCTSEYIRDGLIKRLSKGDSISEVSYIEALCEDAKKAHTQVRDDAGDIGSTVHAFAQNALETGKYTLPSPDAPEYAGCLAFASWLGTVDSRMDLSDIECERIVYSKRLRYAGTTDLFAKVDGKPAVIDFKTGSGFYEDQTLQLAAYAMALDEELGSEIRDGWIIHLDKVTGVYTPYYVEITDELKTDWEAVRIAWRAIKRNQQRHREIKKAKGK